MFSRYRADSGFCPDMRRNIWHWPYWRTTVDTSWIDEVFDTCLLESAVRTSKHIQTGKYESKRKCLQNNRRNRKKRSIWREKMFSILRKEIAIEKNEETSSRFYSLKKIPVRLEMFLKGLWQKNLFVSWTFIRFRNSWKLSHKWTTLFIIFCKWKKDKALYPPMQQLPFLCACKYAMSFDFCVITHRLFIISFLFHSVFFTLHNTVHNLTHNFHDVWNINFLLFRR